MKNNNQVLLVLQKVPTLLLFSKYMFFFTYSGIIKMPSETKTL